MAKRTRVKREPKEFIEELVQLDRVSYVVKGGRRMRFRATMVIGNGKGRVGVGIGKANEVVDAIRKGVADAKNNMATISIVNDTIPHTVEGRFKASRVFMQPAGAGTGIVAGGVVRKVCQLVGIPNILSKTYGSRTKLNVARATLEGLSSCALFDNLKVDKTFDETLAEKADAAKKSYERKAAEEKSSKDASARRKKEEDAKKKAAEAAAEAEKAASEAEQNAPAEEAAPTEEEKDEAAKETTEEASDDTTKE